MSAQALEALRMLGYNPFRHCMVLSMEVDRLQQRFCELESG